MTDDNMPEPVAWLCKLMQEDGTTRTQIVDKYHAGLRWNDAGEPTPYSVTPLYAAPPAPQPVEQICVGCENRPTHENNPCGVCGKAAEPAALTDEQKKKTECGQCAYVRKFYDDPDRYCSSSCAVRGKG